MRFPVPGAPFGHRGPPPHGMRPPPFGFRGPPGMFPPGLRGPPGYRGRGPHPRMGHMHPHPPHPGFRPPPPHHMRGGPPPPRQPHYNHRPPMDNMRDNMREHSPGRGRYQGRGGQNHHRGSRQPNNQIRTILTGQNSPNVSFLGKKRSPQNLTPCEPPPAKRSNYGPPNHQNYNQHNRGPHHHPGPPRGPPPGGPPRGPPNFPPFSQPNSSEFNGQCHSNLRTITLVETAPPPLPRQHHNNTPHGHAKARAPLVLHNPSPTLTSIPISPAQEPMAISPKLPVAAPAPTPKPQHQHPRSELKVLVQNLPSSVNFDKLSTMSASCGAVKGIVVQPDQKSAVIEFCEASSAETFTKQHNRRMMDLAILNVSRLC